MADAKELFDAEIKATDGTSHVIDEIKTHLKSLGQEAEHVGHQTEGIHHPHMWFALGEHIDVTKEKFHGMHMAVGEVGNSITELLPAMAALGAAGSVAALFETTEHTAEAYATLAHNAEALGMTANGLNNLRAVAKLTDTDVGLMERSVGKLNRTLGEAAAGKNKDAAALFRHLHLDPKSFKDGADALPALAAAFAHTESATMRARMAFALFGRSGTDMIPLLAKGREKMKEFQEEASRLNIDFKPYAEGLERYNEDQKKLNLAVGGFTDLLGGKLAPVLAPLTEQATEFILANRQWMTGEIADGVREFADGLKQVPWEVIGGDIKTAAHYAAEFVDEIGGARVAIDVLVGVMALKGVMFLAGPIKETAEFGLAIGKLAVKLTTELVGAWMKVGTAAQAAGEKEMAAAAIATHGGAPGVAAVKAISVEQAAALAESPTAGASLADTVRGRFRAQDARIAAMQAQRLRGQTLVSMFNLGFAAMNAGDGFDLDKDFVREHPDFAKNLSRQQFQGLPDHVAPSLPLLGITGDPKNPGWIERHFDFSQRRDSAALDALDERLSFATAPLPAPAFMMAGQAPGQATASAPPPPGKVDITVHLPNLPPGALLETSQSGAAVGDVRTNLGTAWTDGNFP